MPLETDRSSRRIDPVALERIRAHLSSKGLTFEGELEGRLIGDGLSNLTYRITDGTRSVVLRRPPLPPFDPSAHNVLREARIIAGLASTDVPVATVFDICEDESVIGAPFYVMDYVEGEVMTTHTPGYLADPESRREVALQLVDGLAAIHSVDWRSLDLGRLSQRDDYLERQLASFGRILENGGNRPLRDVTDVQTWLAANLPPRADLRLVHGDYRIGNVMWRPHAPARLAAILDWELASIGDPMADLAFLLATYPVHADSEGAFLSMAPVTLEPGFPGREVLAERYTQTRGIDLPDLRWYVTYVFWRGAVGLESFYQRMVAGTIPQEPYYLSLEEGVPELARRAKLATVCDPADLF